MIDRLLRSDGFCVCVPPFLGAVFVGAVTSLLFS
jgi:hypothetical protein